MNTGRWSCVSRSWDSNCTVVSSPGDSSQTTLFFSAKNLCGPNELSGQ
jgi:hypothetical protein